MGINFTAATTAFNKLLENFGKTLSRTPVTKTNSNISGQENLDSATAVNITGAFFRKEDAWSQDKEGLFQGADAILMVKTSVTINKNDLITYEDESYRINQDPITRRLGGIDFYIMARCFKT